MSLREVRVMKRCNQWDLALKTGISQSRISLIENGYVEPRPEEKRALAKALGVAQKEIFQENAVTA